MVTLHLMGKFESAFICVLETLNSAVLNSSCCRKSMAPFAEEGCKLFVYGINEGISNSELQAEFEKFGPVTDSYNTGKGYAFVTFESKDDASEATDKLNGEPSLVALSFAIGFKFRPGNPRPTD